MDEFALWFEQQAGDWTSARQGGEGGKKNGSMSDALLLEMLTGPEEAEPEPEPGDAADEEEEGGRKRSVMTVEVDGGSNIRRTSSNAEIVRCFQTLQRAAPEQVRAAAEAAGLGAEQEATLEQPQVARLLQELVRAQGGGEVAEEAATLAAEVVVRRCSRGLCLVAHCLTAAPPAAPDRSQTTRSASSRSRRRTWAARQPRFRLPRRSAWASLCGTIAGC